MTLKVGILGKGNVGKALGDGLREAGYDVRHGHRDPSEPVRDCARWADVVVLAVPFGEVGNAVAEAGVDNLDGKVLVDATNVLTPDQEAALGLTTSGAEQLQKFVPGAKVVKCFNTTFAETMRTGQAQGLPLTVFAAGDDGGARQVVLGLARDLGFDGVDAGPLKNARHLEAMGMFNIALGYGQHLGSDAGFQYAHRGNRGREVEAQPPGTRQR